MKRRMFAVVLSGLLVLTGCTGGENAVGSSADTEPTEPWVAENVGVFEAESGVMEGDVYIPVSYTNLTLPTMAVV